MKYLSSAFSLQMLPEGEHNYTINRVGVEQFKDAALRFVVSGSSKGPGVDSYGRPENGGVPSHVPDWDVAAVGHEGTAQALTKILGHEVPVNRQSISLVAGDVLLVAQPTGKRIAYGEEIDFPELSFFIVYFLPAHKCRTLASYWPDELEAALKAAQEREAQES